MSLKNIFKTCTSTFSKYNINIKNPIKNQIRFQSNIEMDLGYK